MFISLPLYLYSKVSSPGRFIASGGVSSITRPECSKTSDVIVGSFRPSIARRGFRLTFPGSGFRNAVLTFSVDTKNESLPACIDVFQTLGGAITPLLIRRAWPSHVVAGAEQKTQQESGSETADVRHVSDTALRVPECCGVLGEYLDHDPEAEDDDGWQFDCSQEKSKEQKIAHPVSGKHDEIRPEH